MGVMRTLFDYAMTGNWEEAQRIQLYKKLGKLTNPDEIKEALKK